MITTLTGKNQVTVPSEIARQLGLLPGSLLDWSLGASPDTIVIRVQPSREDRLRRIRELGATVQNCNLMAELLDERERDA